MPNSRRPTLSVLLILLAFLGGASYLVYRAQGDSRAAPPSRDDERSTNANAGGGTWRHHDWSGPSVEAPPARVGSDGLIQAAPVSDDVYDPQAAAMRRSFPSDGDAGVGLPFPPVEHGARIVSAEGALPVSRNARCEVRVLPVHAGGFNCLVRVLCDGRVLYPNQSQTAGYVPCDVEDGAPIRAVDDGHSAADGDPLVRLDLRAGAITVEDRGDGVEAFRATLQVGQR